MRGTAALVALAALGVGGPSFAAWEVLRQSDSVSLSIDAASIKRSGNNVSFQYLVDYARNQTDFKAGIAYRSLVVKAQVRCKARMIALGNTDLYSHPGGGGVNIGTAFADRVESSYHRVEPASSDEELLRRACTGKAAPAKK